MSEYDEKIDQGARERAEDLAVLGSLTIPPHREEGTFSDRTLTGHVVRKMDGATLHLASGLAIGLRAEAAARLQPGDKIAIEWRGDGGWGSMVMGVVFDGQWIQEQSDEDHDAWYARLKEKAAREEAEFLAEHKAEWISWVEDFPEWLKTPAEALRRDMGETMTWGYQLMAFRLASMYAEMGDVILDKNVFEVPDTEEIKQFSSEHGTTGNQHALGLSFAQKYLQGEY